jgi:hypothetical protein
MDGLQAWESTTRARPLRQKGRLMFLLSHPSLEESEGWGTPDHGRTKMKNMGAPPAFSSFHHKLTVPGGPVMK